MRDRDLLEVLAAMAPTAGAEPAGLRILDKLVEQVVRLLPVTAAGVTTPAGEAGPYVAATGELAKRCEAIQSELGEGPAIAACQTRQCLAVVLRDTARFPGFAARAVEAGAFAVAAYPLRGQDRCFGALDVYWDHAGSLDATEMVAAQTLADVAATYLDNRQIRLELADESDAHARDAAIVDASSDAIVSRTLDGRITRWNTGAERMFGYTSAEAVGQQMALIVPPEFAESIDPILEAAARGEVTAPFETQGRRRDGSRVDVAVSISVIRDRNHAIIGLCGIARDISSTARAVNALRRSEARKAAILHASLDAIVTTDQRGRIEAFNPAAERMFGYDAARVKGQSLPDLLFPPDSRAGHVADLERYIRGGDAPRVGHRTETTKMRADGSTFAAEVALHVIEMDDGLHFTRFIRDLTDANEAETKRLTVEAQMNQSQRLEALGQLAGGVAHDFNNLLAVIRNYAVLVERELPEGGELRSDIGQIISASNHAVLLTRQLLTFARREPVAPEIVDVNNIVQDFQPILDRTLGEQVQLMVQTEADLPLVWIDRGQLEQVLLNLVINARDAMTEGGVLTIETARVEATLDSDAPDSGKAAIFVRLSVADDGEGMSEDVAARAFDPFFTTKAATNGSGLGLATVYGIVKESEGTIEIETEQGVGTTVRVLLPASDEVAQPLVASASIEVVRGEGETILVVEDQSDVRELTVRLLHRGGYCVLDAATGEEAIALFREHKIDLLLTDVIMPRMSGPALVQRLREARPSLPVLYMSGYAHSVLGRQQALDEGLVIIEKPFTEGDLLRAVRAAIAESVAAD